MTWSYRTESHLQFWITKIYSQAFNKCSIFNTARLCGNLGRCITNSCWNDHGEDSQQLLAIRLELWHSFGSNYAHMSMFLAIPSCFFSQHILFPFRFFFPFSDAKYRIHQQEIIEDSHQSQRLLGYLLKNNFDEYAVSSCCTYSFPSLFHVTSQARLCVCGVHLCFKEVTYLRTYTRWKMWYIDSGSIPYGILLSKSPG